MNKVYNIAVIPGDGIGPEVMDEGIKVLEAIAKHQNIKFVFSTYLAGGASLKADGVPILDETLAACKKADAVLLGAVGLPEFDNNPPHLKPEKALLGLRKALGAYCNLRPAKIYPALIDASPLKKEIVEGIDLLVVRELTGGIYFGEPASINILENEPYALNTMIYTESEIRRIAHKAFQVAGQRSKKVTSVDKANVLTVSQLWRTVVEDVASEYPDIELTHMLVDNCAMQLIRWPKQFDVILTGNLFGDILSDEASVLTGSIGMLPSASIGDGAPLYEPVHGSAPDIAGQGKANPIAMIASIAMMLRTTFDLTEAANAIEKSITEVLSEGFHTADLRLENGNCISTTEMGNLITEKTLNLL